MLELSNQLVDHMVLYLGKTKHRFMSLKEISLVLKKKLGDEYTSEISIAVKEALKVHDKLDFFREDTYIHDSKFSYCTGNWVAIKGLYKNPLEGKDKMGWYSWQEDEEIDWNKD